MIRFLNQTKDYYLSCKIIKFYAFQVFFFYLGFFEIFQIQVFCKGFLA